MPVDQELSALATVASLLPTDIIYLVRDPGGGAEADNKAPVSVIDARYASASQGALADTALQAAAIGVSVQAYDAGLAAITAFGRSLIDDVDAAAGRVTLAAAGVGVTNLFTARQDIRAAGGSVAAGLYVPWITGDALPALLAGSATAGNNQIAIRGISDSASAVQGDSTSGAGVRGIATSGFGLFGSSTSGAGGNFVSISNFGIVVKSNTGPAVEAIQATGPVSTVADLFLLRKRPLTTAAAGFGGALLFTLSSSTTLDQVAGRLSFLWADATHASRKARSRWTVHDTAEREGIRIEADGSAAMLSFYGSNAVAKQAVTGSRGGNAALADLLTKLATLGLITDSTTV